MLLEIINTDYILNQQTTELKTLLVRWRGQASDWHHGEFVQIYYNVDDFGALPILSANTGNYFDEEFNTGHLDLLNGKLITEDMEYQLKVGDIYIGQELGKGNQVLIEEQITIKDFPIRWLRKEKPEGGMVLHIFTSEEIVGKSSNEDFEIVALRPGQFYLIGCGDIGVDYNSRKALLRSHSDSFSVPVRDTWALHSDELNNQLIRAGCAYDLNEGDRYEETRPTSTAGLIKTRYVTVLKI